MSVPEEIQHLDFDPFEERRRRVAIHLGTSAQAMLEFHAQLDRIVTILENTGPAFERISRHYERAARRAELRRKRERKRRRQQAGCRR